MTDEPIDELVARASKVSDADLRSPAMRAAMRAAMEDLIDMPDTPGEPGSDDGRPPLADPSYITPETRGRRVPRRALAAVAATVLVATGAAGFLVSRDDGGPPEMDKAGTTTEAEPPLTTVPPAPDGPCPAPGEEQVTGPATTATSTSTTRPDGPATSTTTAPDAPPITATTVPGADGGPSSLLPTWPRTTTSGEAGAATPDGEPTGPPIGDCPPQFPGPDGERTPPDESEAPPEDAPLPERIVFAYRVAYLGGIEHTFTTDSRNGGYSYEMWRDDQTGTWRDLTTGGNGSLHGKPSLDSGPSGFDGNTPTGRRSIDHCFSEYSENGLYGPRNNVTEPVGIKRDFDSGALAVDGNEIVDGREAIRLRYADGDGTIWLDAATLLPFRGAGTFDDGGRYTTTVEFLPRTDANRRLLVPPIPAGFTEVDQFRGDGASRDAGCQEP